MSHHHEPPISLRPQNISKRPDLNGTIYVETGIPTNMPPPPPRSNLSSNYTDASGPSHVPNDVAGVLRRNQACLNCRRRKLKCDAVRPHCGTCVRSHKHLLRTAAGRNALLSCEYDDIGAAPHHREEPSRQMAEDEDDDGETSKKKKKSTTVKRKTRKEEEEEETERLHKKIEALEARLAKQTAEIPAPQQQWADPPPSLQSDNIAAQSPTAFLEMLSSAATAQQGQRTQSSTSGLRDGAAENAMMSSTWAATPTDNNLVSTGLTPFLSFVENQEVSLANDRPVPPRADTGISESMQSDNSRNSSGRVSSQAHSYIPEMLRTSYSYISTSSSDAENLNWMLPVGPEGLQPSTRTEGPWRGVETVTSVAGQDQMPTLVPDEVPTIDPATEYNETVQQQLLMDLFWPGWPQYLPEPNIVNDLVEIFFNNVPNMPRLLNRARLLSRLALPPTHTDFPHPALIHAICAAACSWCDASVYSRSTRPTWTDNPIASDVNMTFAMRQVAFAKESVMRCLDTGDRLFDVVRAMIVLARVFIDETRMLECWTYSGLVSRMILPLGLTVRSAGLALKTVMLAPPVDALEREERRIAVWMAFYHDTIASAASGWGTSMQIDELSVPLPVSAKDFETGAEDMAPNPQDLDSADFWTRHPVEDPFVMTIKATVLFNRVGRFIRKWKNRHIRDDDDLEGMQRPEFRELTNAAACLQMSFPASLRNPARLNSGKKLDIDLICAHLIPHSAIIHLYEPFADVTDPNDGPSRRMFGAAQNIVSLLHSLNTIAPDGTMPLASAMHSSASACFIAAARTILLGYRLAINNNDLQTAEAHRMEMEMIKMTLQAYGEKFKIGQYHAQLIDYMIDAITRPEYEKLRTNYPTHPRTGAPELHPDADLGSCVMNIINIKRGFWRKWNHQVGNSGLSPFGSTPESAAYASSAAGHGASTSASGTGSATDRSARLSRLSSDSPSSLNGPNGDLGYNTASNSNMSSPAIFNTDLGLQYRRGSDNMKSGISPPNYELSTNQTTLPVSGVQAEQTRPSEQHFSTNRMASSNLDQGSMAGGGGTRKDPGVSYGNAANVIQPHTPFSCLPPGSLDKLRRV